MTMSMFGWAGLRLSPQSHPAAISCWMAAIPVALAWLREREDRAVELTLFAA